jgi:hypothetical protein
MNDLFLATISSWEGTIIIGVFSNRDTALSNSISYLLNKSRSTREGDILTPINEEGDENYSCWDITNSDDVLNINKIKVDQIIAKN